MLPNRAFTSSFRNMDDNKSEAIKFNSFSSTSGLGFFSKPLSRWPIKKAEISDASCLESRKFGILVPE